MDFSNFAFENGNLIQFSDFYSDPPHLLKLPYSQRFIISLILTLALIVGLILRTIILTYLRSPGTLIGRPINILIMIEQISSSTLMLHIFLHIVILLTDIPLSSLTGKLFQYSRSIFLFLRFLLHSNFYIVKWTILILPINLLKSSKLYWRSAWYCLKEKSRPKDLWGLYLFLSLFCTMFSH